ncbi:hypothetical protein ACQR2L_05010 [Clostridium butyricum]
MLRTEHKAVDGVNNVRNVPIQKYAVITHILYKLRFNFDLDIG